jgi:hypothetical protein
MGFDVKGEIRLTYRMSDEEVLQRLRTVAAELWESGCPVASPEDRETMVRIAVRRWRSSERRGGAKRQSRDERIEDLAKGLRDAFETDRRVVGPLMDDYRHLARAFAEILMQHAS